MQQIAIDYYNNNYSFSKWTKGDAYEKTKRAVQEKDDTEKKFQDNNERSINSSKLNSINQQKNTADEISTSTDDFEPSKTQYTRLSNKRNTHNELLLQRDPIIQTSINPFITRSNYVDDLNTEADFLRPKDSNLEYQR